jgi:quercetin dioxygenase-like cupin family protein
MSRLLAAVFPVLTLGVVAGALGADSNSQPTSPSKPTYAYATNGVLDGITGRGGDQWKLLLDKSNLGGDELEAAELTLPAGTSVPSHQHGSVEIIYVLSGVYGHEVNGRLYLLKPGMVGIVRPGDSVRHLVPKAGPAKVLIIWAPPGEVARIFRSGKGVAPAPVPQAQGLEP